MDAQQSKSFPAVSLRVLLFLLLGFYLAWSIRVVLLMPVEAGIESFWVKQLIGQTARIALWGLPVFAMLASVHRVSVVRALKLDAVPHGRALRNTIALCVAWLVITMLFGTLVEKRTLTFAVDHTAAEWATIAVTMIWAPIFEEILFRGYVFQALRGHMAWLGAAVISGALFAAGHWPGWIYLQGLHSGLVMQTVSITILGIVLAAVFEHGQSLWPCIILHTLNNLLWA